MQPSANTATAIIKYFLSILVESLSVNIQFSSALSLLHTPIIANRSFFTAKNIPMRYNSEFCIVSLKRTSSLQVTTSSTRRNSQ